MLIVHKSMQLCNHVLWIGRFFRESMSSEINIRELGALLHAKRGVKGLRAVAKEITEKYGPVSSSTLSRVEQGNVPDLDTFVRICRWLEIPTERLMYGSTQSKPSHRQQDTAEVIKAHLRADRTLDPNTADALMKMIQLVYDAAKNGYIGKK
jgi:transcriptional regulator with XRE-family HTH domain